jgi:Domain of unknown function (DUF4375)
MNMPLCGAPGACLRRFRTAGVPGYGHGVYQPPGQITAASLGEITPNELPRVVFLRLVEVILNRDRDRAAQFAYVESLLEGEVVNGGFEQYFFNASRCYVDEAAAGLLLLAAPLHLELLTEAVAAVRTAVPRGLSFRDPGWRQAYVSAGDVAALKTLTYRYWETPSLDPAQAAYIQRHPDQFLTG